MVIRGKLLVETGGTSFALGPGGVFILRPGMDVTVENIHSSVATIHLQAGEILEKFDEK